MRKLTYVLADETRTTSFRIAKASGQAYQVELEKTTKERPKLSPIRQAMIEQFGYVDKSLRNKVVLD